MSTKSKRRRVGTKCSNLFQVPVSPTFSGQAGMPILTLPLPIHRSICFSNKGETPLLQRLLIVCPRNGNEYPSNCLSPAETLSRVHTKQYHCPRILVINTRRTVCPRRKHPGELIDQVLPRLIRFAQIILRIAGMEGHPTLQRQPAPPHQQIIIILRR